MADLFGFKCFDSPKNKYLFSTFVPDCNEELSVNRFDIFLFSLFKLVHNVMPSGDADRFL